MENNGDMATQIGETVPDHHNEETTEWVIQVEQRFQNGSYKTRLSSREVCIFKMPRGKREIERKTYDCDVVPLSPFFYSQDEKELPSAVEDNKLSAVEKTLPRLNVTGIEELINIVMASDKEIRDCYQDQAVECSEKMLAWIMTMGACFIIQFFTYSKEDFNLLFQMANVSNVLEDILKIENQIPLLVLKLILERYRVNDVILERDRDNDAERDRDNDAVSMFASSLLQFFVFGGFPFLPNPESEVKEKIKQYIIDGHAFHLLDLHRMVITDFLLGSPSSSASPSNSSSFSGSASPSAKRGLYFLTEIFRKLNCMCRFTGSADSNRNDNHHCYLVEEKLLPTAEKLTRAGIKFEQSADGKIRFETNSWGSATLFLPRIGVTDTTETYLKNLMALEQFRSCVREGDTRIITYYMFLLDILIDSKEDVAVLRKANIIRSWMGSDEEVADMFNSLCNGIAEALYSPYDEVLERVKEHHDKKLYRLIAELKERYWSKPWLTVSFVGGVLILVMTAVQTVFSVKGK